MNHLDGGTSGVAYGFVDLIPSEDFITGDVESFANGLLTAEQPYEAHGKVVCMGDGPEAGAIAMNDDRLAAADSVDDGKIVPATNGYGDNGLVGKGGADDGDGKAVVPVGLIAKFFAGDFVSGIIPVGVSEGGGLGDKRVSGRLLVNTCGTDKDVLATFATKEPNIALNVFGFEGDEIGYDVEGLALEGFFDGWLIIDIGYEGLGPDYFKIFKGVRTPVENDDFMALGDCKPNAGCTNIASTTDK